MTKIIATLGPSSKSEEMISSLIKAGVSVFRISFAHVTCDENIQTALSVRRVSKRLKEKIDIMLDLPGVQFRTIYPEDVKKIYKRKLYTLGFLEGRKKECDFIVSLPSSRVDLQGCREVLFGDGEFQFTVVDIEKQKRTGSKILTLLSKTSGSILPRRGVTFKNADVKINYPTKEDEKILASTLSRVHPEFVAISFIRHGRDMNKYRKYIRRISKKVPKLIAKVELPKAVDNIESVIRVSDVLMIARGDLALVAGFAKLPRLQKFISKKCIEYQTPFIVATQMMSSMTHSLVPTRAELSDVYNAEVDGASFVMTSGETAIGEYPVETVRMMRNILRS